MRRANASSPLRRRAGPMAAAACAFLCALAAPSGAANAAIPEVFQNLSLIGLIAAGAAFALLAAAVLWLVLRRRRPRRARLSRPAGRADRIVAQSYRTKPGRRRAPPPPADEPAAQAPKVEEEPESPSKRRRARRSKAEPALTLAVSAAHAGVIAWTGSGDEMISPDLAEALGLPEDDLFGFEDALAAFDEAGRREIAAAAARLRENGEEFTSLVRDSVGRRFFQVLGRAANDNKIAAFLWLQNVTDRAAALIHLERHNVRLRDLLDAVPVPIWSRDGDLTITDCNDAYVAAVEAESREAVFATSRELTEGEGAQTAIDLARQALASGAPQEESHKIVVHGDRRTYALSERPIAGGAMTAGVALDRTEVERLRDELQRHIRSQEDILDRLALAIMMFGEDKHLRFVNGAAAKLWQLEEAWLDTGPEVGEVLDVMRQKRLLPETGDFSNLKVEWRNWFTQLLEPREELLHLPNGNSVWMVVSPHPTGGLLVTFEDVTDKLRLERSYNTLVDVQRATLNNLSEGVAVFGEDGNLRLTNPVFRELWGLDETFSDGNPHLSDVIEACKPRFDYGADWEEFKNAYLARIFGRAVRSGRITTKDDRVFAYGIVPMPDGGVLLSYRDITDTIRVERALRERNEALEAADRLKSEFVANVSYELRSPLTSILGFAEVMQKEYAGALTDKQSDYLASIVQASERLEGLINDIIDLSVIEAGRMVLDISPIDVRELVNGLAELMRERMRERGVGLDVACAPEVKTFDGDGRRVRQVLYNLLINAVTFTDPGGSVTLTVERRDEDIAFVVADTGVGIEADDRDAVFGPFVQGVTTDRRYQGAGLGLSLVKRFVELHGGTVELVSEAGKGTTVTCLLPTAQAATSPSDGGDGASAASHQQAAE